MNIAEHVALIQNEPVGVFSLEMTAESLILRMLCSRARINLRAVRDGFFAERDFPRITQAATEMAKAPLFIDDTLAFPFSSSEPESQNGPTTRDQTLVIDYLQLLNSTEKDEPKIANKRFRIFPVGSKPWPRN